MRPLQRQSTRLCKKEAVGSEGRYTYLSTIIYLSIVHVGLECRVHSKAAFGIRGNHCATTTPAFGLNLRHNTRSLTSMPTTTIYARPWSSLELPSVGNSSYRM
jgi:hypothetical protein